MRYLILYNISGDMKQEIVAAPDVNAAIARFTSDHPKAEVLCATDTQGNRFDSEGQPERNRQLDN
jgi:hypothetical protein